MLKDCCDSGARTAAVRSDPGAQSSDGWQAAKGFGGASKESRKRIRSGSGWWENDERGQAGSHGRQAGI